MADLSNISGINIISFIIGSGLIVFGANILYSDYIKQPHVIIEIEPRSSSAATVSLSNTGIATAHNLRATFYSNASNITDYKFAEAPSEEINFTEFDDPQRLVANTSRLTPDNKFAIITPLSLNPDITAAYNVEVTYDEGSTYGAAYLGKNPKPFMSPMLSGFQFTKILQFMSTLIFLVTVAYLSPYIINSIKGLIQKIDEGVYVSRIKKEIERIQEMLQKDNGLYNNRIPVKTWNQYDTKRKSKIFYKYEDYKRITELYKELNRRDYSLKKYIDKNIVGFYNDICLRSTNECLKNINWKEYAVKLRKARIVWITIGIVVLLLMFAALNYVEIYLTQ